MSFTISYDPLWATLKAQQLKKIDLVRKGFITTTTLRKLRDGEPVSLNIIGSLCVGLGVSPADIVEFKALDGVIM